MADSLKLEYLGHVIRRGFLAVLVAAGCSAGLPAAANAVVFPGAPQPYQRWADQAKVPTVARSIDLIEEHCPGYVEPACTSRDGKLYLDGPWFRSGVTTADGRIQVVLAIRETLLHELGHQIDYVMPAWVRTRFTAITRDRRPWSTPPNSPHEQFAGVYALCGIGGRLARVADWPASAFAAARRRRTVCRLIRGLRFPGLRRAP